jgi:phospholipase/carboxylesterase
LKAGVVLRISLTLPLLLLGLACRASDAAELEVITGGADRDDPLPLVIALHGYGDTPENFQAIFTDWPFAARVIVPRGYEEAGRGRAWFQARVQGGEPELSRGAIAAADRLAPWIAAMAKSRPTIGRPIVTGFSQGGILSFTLATRHPEVIGTAIPLAGLLPQGAQPIPGRPTAPVIALHGDADSIVPYGGAKAGVATLVASQAQAELVTYPGVDHRLTPAILAELQKRIAAAITKGR